MLYWIVGGILLVVAVVAIFMFADAPNDFYEGQ